MGELNMELQVNIKDNGEVMSISLEEYAELLRNREKDIKKARAKELQKKLYAVIAEIQAEGFELVDYGGEYRKRWSRIKNSHLVVKTW